MPYTQWSDTLPQWGSFLLSFSIIGCALAVGFLIGMYDHRKSSAEPTRPIGSIVGATLGLLAFFLAFTFGYSANRFDVRKQLVRQDGTALTTAYMRATLLPEPYGSTMQNLLQEYIELREQPTSGQIAFLLQRSEEIHLELWSQIRELSRNNQGTKVRLMIQSLNDLMTVHNNRVAVGLDRIPTMIWIALYSIAIMAMLGIGYQSGLSGARRPMVSICLAIAFSVVITLIADLDQGLEGSLRVNQRPMVDALRYVRTYGDILETEQGQ